jgi:hypothetical protein
MKVERDRDAAAHELGHVIGHIVTGTNFDYVWIAGVDKWWDKRNQDEDPKKWVGGYIRTYREGTMTFDGKRVKCATRDTTAEEWLLTLLAGIAGEEVFAGQEKPRSIIDLSQEYRQWEGKSGAYGDFRIAQKWVKQGVEDGYFHAKQVWAVLQAFLQQGVLRSAEPQGISARCYPGARQERHYVEHRSNEDVERILRHRIDGEGV